MSCESLVSTIQTSHVARTRRNLATAGHEIVEAEKGLSELERDFIDKPACASDVTMRRHGWSGGSLNGFASSILKAASSFVSAMFSPDQELGFKKAGGAFGVR